MCTSNIDQQYLQFEGKTINKRYFLNRAIGQGGYGCVYQGTDQHNNHEVAIKIMLRRQEQKEYQRQQQEIELAKNLSHPNILPCFDSGEERIQDLDILYIVMELATETLEQRLQQNTLSSREVKKMALDIAKSIQYLQTSETGEIVLHRDLKPENLLLVKKEWKLCDFGIVKTLNNQSAISTQALGTPFYSPPEAYRGEYTTTSDCWSLGLILAKALTGKHPFCGQYSESSVTSETLLKAVLQEEPDLKNLPQEFQNLVRGCLVKDPRKRWNVKQVIENLSDQSTPVSTRVQPQLTQPINNIYSTLENYLRNQEFQKADQETFDLINQENDQNGNSIITMAEIDRMECQVLCRIDELWSQHSDRRFGFNAQMETFNIRGQAQNTQLFLQAINHVGWTRPELLLEKLPSLIRHLVRVTFGQIMDEFRLIKYYDALTFDISAPKGHLPAKIWSHISQLNSLTNISNNISNVNDFTENFEEYGTFIELFTTKGIPNVYAFLNKLESCNIK